MAIELESQLSPGGQAEAEAAEPRYLNRELSWLEFDARVLALTEDPTVPLLERVKFCAIFAMNLDEFFYVRVAGLKDQVAARLGPTAPDGIWPAEQLTAIRRRVTELLARLSTAFVGDIVPALANAGVRLVEWSSLDAADRLHLVQVFDERIFPVLTPLAVDPGHPFPYISNLSLNLAVIVRDPDTAERRFARVKVATLLDRFVALPDGERFVPLEQLIAAHLDQLFPGMEIECHYPFRVTRNADLTLEEEEADDLLAAVEMELRRQRFGRAVRLEIGPGMSDEVRELLTAELDLTPDDVYELDGPLDPAGLMALHELERPDLKDEPFQPTTQPVLQGAENAQADIFAVLRERDVLMHHPYDSFVSSVEAFIAQASRDPSVLAIKQTLYRTSGDSPIVRSLIRATERGKQVVALIEVKARGDELANIAWARALEEAGVHVVYGLVGLKTHCKAALVVREEPEGIRRYCHLGTGNYNSNTARLYEDVGLLTADPAIGADLTDLFNYLTGYSRRVDYRRVEVAPSGLRTRMLDLIAREAEDPNRGRIIMKMNSLVDQDVVDALYDASARGVRIDLVVRGVCCLRPGVPGLSDNIRVRSIVGRYLEHSRIYFFANRGNAEYYIASADMMPRNLDSRVEVIVPVADPDLQARLEEVLTANLDDDALAWELGPDDEWRKVPARQGLNVQLRLQELALERVRRRRDGDARGPQQLS
ncbi:MAG: RNA degradosome polyphosphate kinase [Actinobacteria bacterium]|nr:RNA degradosome polyphosphate kinase [Actinomycetota bacterium]